MKYALLIVEIDDVREGSPRLHSFLNIVSSLQSAGNKATALSAGAYLCDLQHGLTDLTAISAAAEERGYAHRVLFFEETPPFVISKPRKPL